jgi:serine/threonine protein kinase
MIGMDIMDRLKIVHDCGFIYRDMKPENIVVGQKFK